MTDDPLKDPSVQTSDPYVTQTSDLAVPMRHSRLYFELLTIRSSRSLSQRYYHFPYIKQTNKISFYSYRITHFLIWIFFDIWAFDLTLK